MKRRIFIGSMLAIFLILSVSATSAIQVQTIKRELSTPHISYEMFNNMDTEQLIALIQSLSQDYPQLLNTFQRAVEQIENTPPSSMDAQHQSKLVDDNTPRSQQRNDNQTFLEKIYWKIYNYRVFRLVLSVLLFLSFQSKLTLWRTMTWGIRILRWTKLGILLGFIDPSQKPQTPNIDFQQDLGNNTLTVTSASAKIFWSDIAEIGAGSCDPFPEGNVTVGDAVTNCSGIVVLQYLPTYEILGVFEFD